MISTVAGKPGSTKKKGSTREAENNGACRKKKFCGNEDFSEPRKQKPVMTGEKGAALWGKGEHKRGHYMKRRARILKVLNVNPRAKPGAISEFEGVLDGGGD